MNSDEAFRLITCVLLALTSAALTPQHASAAVREPYTFCAKIGGWDDTDGTGYHLIHCANEIHGCVDYIYIKHGIQFTFETVR